MPTKEVTLQYINTGVGKTGKPFWNFKTTEGETFWSNQGHAIPWASEGLSASVDYTVNRNGGFQIVKLGADEIKYNGMKPAPGKPNAAEKER